VVATIPVGIFLVGVAITPDGTHAYVVDGDLSSVLVIDTATNTLVATIPVGARVIPAWIAITPAPRVPRNKEQCKHSGWKNFGPPAGPFKSQGQCVSYVEHHSH